MTRRTLAKPIDAEGVALHAGSAVHMRLAPAPSGTGVVFRRSDLGGREVPARYDRVGETRLGTVIEEDGVSVGVVEHLMAAVAARNSMTLSSRSTGPSRRSLMAMRSVT